MKNKLGILSAAVLSLAIAGSTFAQNMQTTQTTPTTKGSTANSKMSGTTMAKKTSGTKHKKGRRHTAKSMKKGKSTKAVQGS